MKKYRFFIMIILLIIIIFIGINVKISIKTDNNTKDIDVNEGFTNDLTSETIVEDMENGEYHRASSTQSTTNVLQNIEIEEK